MSVNCPACGASVASLVFDGSGAASCPNCAGTIQFHGGSQPTVLLPSSGDSDASDATAVERAHHPLLGRYELLNELGHGGFGTVYRARDTQLDRIVALKIPHSGAFVSADEKARFLREAQTAAGLEHPAIVRVFDAGQINGTPYIASQLVEGKTLANVVAIRNLSTRESAELIARIGDALQHAHEHRLVHRDIKPGNIMVGPDGRPMLMDFGLAKDFQRDTNQTTEGWIKGTPAYMSPEQASTAWASYSTSSSAGNGHFAARHRKSSTPSASRISARCAASAGESRSTCRPSARRPSREIRRVVTSRRSSSRTICGAGCRASRFVRGASE